MKRVSLLIIALLVFPAMLLAQYRVKAVHQEPVSLKIDLKGYNDRLPAASMNATFLFDQETETLVVTMNQSKVKCDFNKIWLPQHDVTVSEMGKYTKARGIKVKKAQTFVDQENFLNLSNRTLTASILTTDMTFNGVYDLKAKKKVKKQLDHQMVPLDGNMELRLTFKTNPKSKTATLILKNPIPMNRKGSSKGVVGYVADDVVITIDLGRCKNADQLIATIMEYEALFRVAEAKVNELKTRPQDQKAYRTFILQEYAVIDTNRFVMATCDEVQEHWGNLSACIKRIKKQKAVIAVPDDCDVARLNKEIKDNTNKLNNLVNDWQLASDAASKAEKKAAFDAIVQALDKKLSELPTGCKAKLDSKLLKNYEFVKKLIK